DYNHADDTKYKKLRDAANAEYEQKKLFSEKSQAAYRADDHVAAKEYSQKAAEHEQKMNEYNRQAAEFVFRANNADSDPDEIDLHGLYVREAEEYLAVRIRAAKARGDDHLEAIVGKGIHSENHVQKLKPAVEKLCKELGFRYSIDDNNAGVIVIDLKSAGGQVP
ncbi:hypothetical protein CANCADRAFT_18133, partial [Tortispora caseinolytica NRRL Y-17796]